MGKKGQKYTTKCKEKKLYKLLLVRKNSRFQHKYNNLHSVFTLYYHFCVTANCKEKNPHKIKTILIYLYYLIYLDKIKITTLLIQIVALYFSLFMCDI